jgi:hypothetical protein
MTLPLGMRTASDDPTTVSPTQKAIPTGMPFGAPLIDIAKRGGRHSKNAATRSTPLESAKRAIKDPSRRFNATPRSGVAI